MVAVVNSKLECVKALLDAGAQTFAIDKVKHRLRACGDVCERQNPHFSVIRARILGSGSGGIYKGKNFVVMLQCIQRGW